MREELVDLGKQVFELRINQFKEVENDVGLFKLDHQNQQEEIQFLRVGEIRTGENSYNFIIEPFIDVVFMVIFKEFIDLLIK